MKLILLLAFVLVFSTACAGRPYIDQDRFDQWVVSCQAAESTNAERCARSMYTMQQRNAEASKWTW